MTVTAAISALSVFSLHSHFPSLEYFCLSNIFNAGLFLVREYFHSRFIQVKCLTSITGWIDGSVSGSWCRARTLKTPLLAATRFFPGGSPTSQNFCSEKSLCCCPSISLLLCVKQKHELLIKIYFHMSCLWADMLHMCRSAVTSPPGVQSGRIIFLWGFFHMFVSTHSCFSEEVCVGPVKQLHRSGLLC